MIVAPQTPNLHDLADREAPSYLGVLVASKAPKATHLFH
jgi:hypothetical protein